MPSGRRRGSSFAEGRRRRASSLDETNGSAGGVDALMTQDSLEAAHQILQLLCQHSQDSVSGKSLLHATDNVCKAKALLDRAHQLDFYTTPFGKIKEASNWLPSLLRQRDLESGYTPLHWAVFKAKLPVLLLLLRYCATVAPTSAANSSTEKASSRADSNSGNNNVEDFMPVMSSTRMMHRPMALLQGDVSGVLSEQVKSVVMTRDNEGLTAFLLLEQLQAKELKHCRQSIARHNKLRHDPNRLEPSTATRGGGRQHRGNSFDWILQQEHLDQNELADLHRFMDQEQQQMRQENQAYALLGENMDEISPEKITYGCEILAFGRANHLALGVQGGNRSSSSTTNRTTGSDKTATFRPQRVQQFAQDRVGRIGSAVAVAAAAHHTLVVTRQGHLFAFGVGTGGRLGTGDNERHCPAPTRVLGALAKRHVVAISAAENHSLCVTSDGAVYAWGSNRFGQLGYQLTSTNNDPPSPSSSRCCVPRRVEDLWKKNVRCCSVAAGEKHSVALSQAGEVYVWGDNSAGQLGVSHRRGSGVGHKVQRVDALWNSEKRALQIAASAQSTLTLVGPNAGGLPTNQVYSWGHGSHVPSKVDFHRAAESRVSARGHHNHVNPVAIACARYHNAAISSDGRVYTWGLHSDPLGSPSSKQASLKSNQTYSCPQLVTAMLPEEGGGFAVAVAASETHTAVVTDCGGLFTWGASYGKDVLGHEGVRWQPSPKRVSGVHRAVGLAVAKEHTVLLVGASFPPLLNDLSAETASCVNCLELLAAREAARHVDLFNVLPVLMTAERTHSHALTEYCQEFVRMNFDGVLNLGQKSVMDLYLMEQLSIGLLLLDEEPRDRREHPLIMDMIRAGKTSAGNFESEEILSDPGRWILACEKIRNREPTKTQVYKMLRQKAELSAGVTTGLYRRGTAPSSIGSIAEKYDRDDATTDAGTMPGLTEGRSPVMSSSERCLALTSNMDLSSRELVQAKYHSLTKEVRGVKKRLNQIAMILKDSSCEAGSVGMADLLSPEQKEKVVRRPYLESKLAILQPALERVQRSMRHYNLRLKEDVNNTTMTTCPEHDESAALRRKEECSSAEKQAEPEPSYVTNADETKLRCMVCNIACPDEKSYALHVNGRKHRNRVAQAAEEEKQQAAAAIMEQRQRQQMKRMSEAAVERTAHAAPKPLSAWGNSKGAQPKYKLPPPPHALPTSVETSVEAPTATKSAVVKSFQEILAEEAAFAAKSTAVATPLKLPAGSAPALKCPPWATKPVVQVSPVSLVVASPQTPLRQGSKVGFPAPSSSASSSKKVASSVWNKTPSPQLPFAATSTAPVGSANPRSTASFGDFLATTPLPSKVNQRSRSSSAPWASPQFSKSTKSSTVKPTGCCAGAVTLALPDNATASAPSSSVRFQEIQRAEQAFKQVQDQGVVDNGKWFIERRERAGSFATIQEIANTEREHQLLVEEQLRIEQEIQRENALKKKQEEQQRRKEQQLMAKKNQKKKTQQRTKGEENQTEGGNGQAPTTATSPNPIQGPRTNRPAKERRYNNSKNHQHQNLTNPGETMEPPQQQREEAANSNDREEPTTKSSNYNNRRRNRNRYSEGASAGIAPKNEHEADQ